MHTKLCVIPCRWLENLRQTLLSGPPNENVAISWSAYHASHQVTPPEDSDLALSSMLPIFHVPAKSVAMIRHSMDILKTAVAILNPGQTPIITCDQPLYAVAKQIQWSWPTTHGEEHIVVMFRGLHIEKWLLLSCLEIFWKVVGGLEHLSRQVL